MDNIERRFIDVSNTELRMVSQNGKRYIEGYGSVYNTLSEPMHDARYGTFREVFRQGSFRDSLSKHEIKAQLDHTGYLARQKNGTLTIQDREKGIWYSAQIPDTSVGRDAIALAERGDLIGSSFTFANAADSWREESVSGERTYIREVTAADIYEVSPVFDPAYSATENSLAIRSLDKWKTDQSIADKYAKQLEQFESLKKYFIL